MYPVPAPIPPVRHRRRKQAVGAAPLASIPPQSSPRPTLLRCVEEAVVDIPVPVLSKDTRQWAATVWPDARQPGGWGRALWWPHPWRAGFQPVALAYSDVIEFGADMAAPGRRARGRGPASVPVRWYGVVLERRPGGLLVHGPFPTPAAAHQVATDLRATIASYVIGNSASPVHLSHALVGG